MQRHTCNDKQVKQQKRIFHGFEIQVADPTMRAHSKGWFISIYRFFNIILASVDPGEVFFAFCRFLSAGAEIMSLPLVLENI